MEVKTYLEQDSTLTKLTENTQIAPAPFSLIFGFEGWEVQGADTNFNFDIMVWLDNNLTNTILNDFSSANFLENPKLSVVNFNKHEKNLWLSSQNQLRVNRFGLIRKKGTQTCNFTFCSEAPGWLKLHILVNNLSGKSIQSLNNKKLYYSILYKSSGHQNQINGTISFASK